MTLCLVRFRVLEGAGYALEGQKKHAEARERFEALSKLNSGAVVRVRPQLPFSAAAI